MLDHPVDTGDDVEHAAATGTRQHSNGHDRDRFGNTHRLAADGAGNVRAVPVAVLGAPTVVHMGAAGHHSPTELAVVATHAGVDDVRVHTRAGEVVGVVVVAIHRSLIDAVETPRRRVCLVGFDAHHGVFLDERHVGIAREK